MLSNSVFRNPNTIPSITPGLVNPINAINNLMQAFEKAGTVHFEKDFYSVDELIVFLTQIVEYVVEFKKSNEKMSGGNEKMSGSNKKTRRNRSRSRGHKSRGHKHKSRGHKSRGHKTKKNMHGGSPIFMVFICIMILCSAFGQLQMTPTKYNKYIESIENLPSPALLNFIAPGKCASNAALVAGFLDMEEWKKLNRQRFIADIENDSKMHPSSVINKLMTSRIYIHTDMSDIKSKIITAITPFLLPGKVTIGYLSMVTKQLIPGTAGSHGVMLAVETDSDNNPIKMSIIDVGRRYSIVGAKTILFTGSAIDKDKDEFTLYLNQKCHIDEDTGFATSIRVGFSKMQKNIDFEKYGNEIAETEKKLLKDISFGTVTKINNLSKMLCNIGLQMHKLLYYLFKLNLLQDS